MMELVVQQKVFEALDGNLSFSAGVYDDPPFLPEGEVREDFPFVVIGGDNSRRFDNDSNVGKEVAVILHVWSRQPGMKELKTLMGEIEDLLNRATFTEAGYQFVDCLNVNTAATVDPDGRTRHGVMRFNVTIQKTS